MARHSRRDYVSPRMILVGFKAGARIGLFLVARLLLVGGTVLVSGLGALVPFYVATQQIANHGDIVGAVFFVTIGAFWAAGSLAILSLIGGALLETIAGRLRLRDFPRTVWQDLRYLVRLDRLL